MSLIILHGDQQVVVRNELAKMMDQWSKLSTKITQLDGVKVTRGEVEVAVGSQSLIPIPIAVVIEGLLSRPKSKAKQVIIDFLANAVAQTPDLDLVLVEPKALTAAQLKSVPAKAQVKNFPLSKAIFKYVENIQAAPSQSITALRSAIFQESAELCLVMLIRQIRLLIATVTNTPMKDSPFVINKARMQARYFTLPQLKQAQDKLFRLDQAQKTGRSRLTLQQDLEQFQLWLYASKVNYQ